MEEIERQLFHVLYSYVEVASTLILRPYLSQSDKLFLINGTKKSKYVVASKTALLSFFSNVKIMKFLKETVLELYLNFFYIL